MKIKDAIHILKAQLSFERTPKGRSVSEYAKNTIAATLEDEKNYEMECKKCVNCGIILSELLRPEGCPNCGSKDKTIEIIEGE